LFFSVPTPFSFDCFTDEVGQGDAIIGLSDMPTAESAFSGVVRDRKWMLLSVCHNRSDHPPVARALVYLNV